MKSLLHSLWILLTCLGPAPVKEATSEAGAPSGRGMFDAPDDDDDGDDDAARSEVEEEEVEDLDDDQDADDDADDQDDDQDADDQDDAEESEEDEDLEDDDEEEDDEEEEDEDDEEEEDDEPDEAAQALRQSWEARLQTSPDPDPAPRLNVDGVSLREEARERFARLRDKGDEGEHDADAIFEIAMDAVAQTLGAYHNQVAAPGSEKVSKTLRNQQVGRNLREFRAEVGERLTPAIEDRMGAIYTEIADSQGWRKADQIPLKDLFKMAGGRLSKPRGKKAKRSKAKKKTRAQRQKQEALAATRGPKAIGRTSPGKGKGKGRTQNKELAETAEHIRSTRPFFSLG